MKICSAQNKSASLSCKPNVPDAEIGRVVYGLYGLEEVQIKTSWKP